MLPNAEANLRPCSIHPVWNGDTNLPRAIGLYLQRMAGQMVEEAHLHRSLWMSRVRQPYETIYFQRRVLPGWAYSEEKHRPLSAPGRDILCIQDGNLHGICFPPDVATGQALRFSRIHSQDWTLPRWQEDHRENINHKGGWT